MRGLTNLKQGKQNVKRLFGTPNAGPYVKDAIRCVMENAANLGIEYQSYDWRLNRG